MIINILKNYVTRIKASVGSTLFQHLYVAADNGRDDDVANNGELSCAIHVSSILTLSGLIDRPHATVMTTLRKMKDHGWVETQTPVPGAVIHWPESEDGHEHIGFWLEPGRVVSNSTVQRVPVEHNESMPDGREPLAYYTHPSLAN